MLEVVEVRSAGAVEASWGLWAVHPRHLNLTVRAMVTGKAVEAIASSLDLTRQDNDQSSGGTTL